MRTVTVTPVANANGTSTITITVSDGQLTATDTFSADGHCGKRRRRRCRAVANQTTSSGVAVGPLAVTVGDVETAAASLILSGQFFEPHARAQRQHRVRRQRRGAHRDGDTGGRRQPARRR